VEYRANTDPAAATPAETAALPALLVRAGAATYGVPLERCREILERPVCTPIPGTGAHVRGLINLRGRLVTVLDLGAWLAAEPSAHAEERAVVIVEQGGRPVGMLVDDVVRIARVEAAPLAGGAGAVSGVDLHRCADVESAAGGARVMGLLDLDSVVGSAFAR
jgi:purine-binding chemotaxis protein CheW